MQRSQRQILRQGLAVNRPAKHIQHPPQQLTAHRNTQRMPGINHSRSPAEAAGGCQSNSTHSFLIQLCQDLNHDLAMMAAAQFRLQSRDRSRKADVDHASADSQYCARWMIRVGCQLCRPHYTLLIQSHRFRNPSHLVHGNADYCSADFCVRCARPPPGASRQWFLRAPEDQCSWRTEPHTDTGRTPVGGPGVRKWFSRAVSRA